LEGTIHDVVKVLAWNLLGRTEENFETSFKIISVLAEIQIEHLLHYCYTDVLSAKQFLNGGKLMLRVLTLHHSNLMVNEENLKLRNSKLWATMLLYLYEVQILFLLVYCSLTCFLH
jgi:hypothetical protein